jgi:hypothetical protein
VLQAGATVGCVGNLNRIFGLILGAVVVNVAAMIDGMFGVAKLLGH